VIPQTVRRETLIIEHDQLGTKKEERTGTYGEKITAYEDTGLGKEGEVQAKKKKKEVKEEGGKDVQGNGLSRSIVVVRERRRIRWGRLLESVKWLERKKEGDQRLKGGKPDVRVSLYIKEVVRSSTRRKYKKTGKKIIRT